MLSWNVFYEDINTRAIIIKDIFDGGYYERVARDLKAKLVDKSAFADSFRNELMRQFGGRAEYEIVITSWPPHVNVDDITTVQKRIVVRTRRRWRRSRRSWMCPWTIS